MTKQDLGKAIVNTVALSLLVYGAYRVLSAPAKQPIEQTIKETVKDVIDVPVKFVDVTEKTVENFSQRMAKFHKRAKKADYGLAFWKW